MCLLALLGAFFYTDENNLYHRGDWYWSSFTFATAVNAVNIALTIRNRHRLNRMTLVCLLHYTIMPIVAGALQSFTTGLNLAIIAGVLSLVIVLFELQRHASRMLPKAPEGPDHGSPRRRRQGDAAQSARESDRGSRPRRGNRRMRLGLRSAGPP